MTALARLFGDLLSPPACAACDVAIGRGVAFCAACAATIERTAPTGDLFAPFAYGGALAVAIRRLKYGERPDVAAPIGALLAGACSAARLEADVVIPVPLHPRRLAERGYNQAALLAAAVARGIGARHLARGLRRDVETAHQAELDRRARSDNVRGVFSARDPRLVRGRRVVLIDDVATTGATLDAAQGALEAAGVGSVQRVVVARTPMA